MKQKRIMMLGGNYVQMTATKAAKALGYYVISVDYLPNNPAHKFADEYHNVSTIDKEAVLSLARELKIDGIVSYASDVSAPTAAYVSEKLGLPTNPYESVNIMTHKDLFRAFLKENNFPMPQGAGFSDYGKALEFFRTLKKPVMVKPVDSSGSKGANRVFTEEEFVQAWQEAMSYSISKNVIVEEFIRKVGYQIDGDIFVVDGQIVFWGICDQHHDLECSAYAPTGHSFPPTQDPKYQENARNQVQRLLNLLHMKMGAYNLEYIIGQDGEVYLLEVGPRNGGNMISDAVRAATGFDMAAYTCRQAVGEDCSDVRQMQAVQYCSSYVIHSRRDGIYRGISFSDEIKDNILLWDVTVSEGEEIHRFRNASFGIGFMICRFDTIEEMCYKIDNMTDYINIIVD